jgi:hypothetical protein
VRLEGSLDAFSLSDIFSLLSMTKKTGGLHLRRPGGHGAVWLTDGLITGGASELSRLSLARRLAGTGQVAENDLSAAVEEMRRSEDVGVARALRDSRAIDEGELHNLVREHIVDSVFDLMRWPDGVFEFVIDEANIDDVGVTREVDEVVTESRRRIDIWSAIDERLANPQAVLSLALDLDDDPQLQRDEWEMVALLDGRRTIGDLVGICGRGEYAVVVALAELVNRGVVRPDDPEGVAAMLRRQALIAALETTSSVDVVTAPELPAEPSTEYSRRAGDRLAGENGAAPDSNGHSSVTKLASVARSGRELPVTPQRPEPFLPEREPDHPEPMAAAMAGGGGVVGSSAVPAGLIERDPSVNKSLLLRLIAGVRGL